MYISNYRRRTKTVFILLSIFLISCVARLVFIQFFRSSYLCQLAKKQHNLFVELEPVRGSIYDAQGKPQALNLPADSLYAAPNKIRDKEEVIKQASPILNLDYAYLRDRLNRDKSFIWIARKVAPSQAQKIKDSKIRGFGFLKESKRSYPNSYLASQVFGFAGLDNIGLEGLEVYYDRFLKGEAGWAVFLRDARQKQLDLWEKMVLPKDGYDLVLTIDEVIQYIAERELERAFKSSNAKAGTIVVMDPHTGAILALANRPTYDLNGYARADKDSIRNRAICDVFEPGSVFKIVTASAALEEGKVAEEDKFFCEEGKYRVAGHTLHDHRPHEWLTFRQVIEESSNIGVTKVAQILGSDIIYRYIKAFGFGSKSGIDLPGEVSGIIKEPSAWSKTSIAAIPMGQEVAVTSLQLASAISVIANGGQLMRPYIVSRVQDKYGQVIKKFNPAMTRKVISSETAGRVRDILMGVVENGTGKRAGTAKFAVAGKTGTAQKLEEDGSYSHNKFIASFIGFAPAPDPLVAIVVVLDEPYPNYFGGTVAAPVFKNAATDIINYLKREHPEQAELNRDESRDIS